mmetsp:Transcript_101024/g.324404  ORF Transcript_101024/g.324404 Transcript_101024/m.324404 type:complete len:408 (+) Transcript_101024:139-1362(+)|eukprot:CAMPEP_0203913936 /NCGR_PEP_ID=MMETSP0359-20131031/54885_1 /ASSEMBLY_ACC=CAM_ASM_000338 /TAXON_ID=268821 /ORGANISM="Scrippsiella Hangoei, Strain SHTV-5" /LENGTH=407 /DNA_ID=CAMNT_0050840175 /DNA_START=81 /DNA_END=1304 /DNA_ORIENTATION=+
MVEIKLEVAGDTAVLKDCYVAVRLGDAQKLSKFTGSKTYSFRTAGPSAVGKVEVFRRIGSCSVDLGAMEQPWRVDIGCNDPVLKNLPLSIGMEKALKEVAAEPEKHSAMDSKLALAKGYLGKHQVEFHLGQAMMRLLKELPEDPLEFLASYLREVRREVAPVAKAVLPSPVSVPTASTAASAASPTPAAVAAAPHCLRPFRMRPSVGSWLPPAPAFAPAAEPVAAPVAAAAAPAPAAVPEGPALRMLPSASTWMQPRPKGLWRPRMAVVRRLRGLRPIIQGGHTEEVCEAERLLCRAFSHLGGEFEGQYFPLQGSWSYPPRPGGMSVQEESSLESRNLLFEPRTGGPWGRGVFATATGDFAAYVNEGDHVRLISMEGERAGGCGGALAALERFERALTQALGQDLLH